MEGAASRSARRRWLRGIQIAVTITLCVLLLRQMAWADMSELAARLRWEFVALSVVLVLFSHLLNVMRWQYILQQQAIGYGRLLSIYGAGLFSNNFLPTGIGGDGVRVGLLSRSISFARAMVSVGLDRGIAFFALSALLLPGLWFRLPPGLAFDGDMLAALVSAPGVALVAFALLAAILLGLVLWKCSPALRARAGTIIERLRGSEGWTVACWRRIFLGSYLLAVVSHACLVLAYWTVIQALRIEVSPGAAVWLYLIGSVALLLPIAVNGIGLQEGIYVALLAGYSVPAAAALGVGFIIRMLIVLFSLLGGLLSLKWST